MGFKPSITGFMFRDEKSCSSLLPPPPPLPLPVALLKTPPSPSLPPSTPSALLLRNTKLGERITQVKLLLFVG